MLPFAVSVFVNQKHDERSVVDPLRCLRLESRLLSLSPKTRRPPRKHLFNSVTNAPLCLSLPLTPLQEEEKAAPSASKKPAKGRPLLSREKSADSSSTSSSASAEKQRQEARKRLLAAKKAASFRQNSATESADSIEIYVPEAQTRL